MFFTTSIQRCIAATLVLLIAPLAIGAIWVIASAMWDVASANRSIQLAKADKAILMMASAMRSQRGDIQTAFLTADDPRPLVAQRRQEMSKALAGAIADLRATDLRSREQLAKAMSDNWATAEPLYGDLSAEGAKPKEQRTLAATNAWFDGMERTINSVLAASAATSRAVRRVDPYFAQLQDFKEEAWNMRANHGSQCTLLRPNFAGDKPLDVAQGRRLGEQRGKVALSSGNLAGLTENATAPAMLKSYAQEAVATVAKNNAQSDELLGKLGSGKPPIGPGEWTKLCNEPFAPILAVVATSLDEIIGSASKTFVWSLAKLGGAIVVALAMAGIGVASWLGLRNRISRPVVELRSTLERLQAGNLDEPVAAARYPDEIGALSSALEGYRENSLALERGRRERESLQEHQLAEAAASQALVASVTEVVAGAKAGDFSGRVDLGDVQGSVRRLAEGVNAINDVVDRATNELADVLRAVAGGDLTRTIVSTHDGRFGELRDAVNDTVGRLSQTMSAIQSSAREVSNASGEISASTTDLSQRTEEQAASLEETSASMEEIAATVKKNAENAQTANQSADGAREVADRGGKVVSEAVGAMARIEESSRKISDIIGVIDEIARQTNLLALNAAVEAARAGEAGRGFAVVASEVRSLAQRSSQAAKDIKDLIVSSNGQVKEGVDLVNRAGASLAEITGSIKKVAEIVSDIASASAEQSVGIAEVNKALTQMDEVTQQNSALVEENAATAKTLEQQATAMDEGVRFFKVGHTAETFASAEQARSPARQRRAA